MEKNLEHTKKESRMGLGQKLIIKMAQGKRPTILKALLRESKLHMCSPDQWTTTKG